LYVWQGGTLQSGFFVAAARRHFSLLGRAAMLNAVAKP
jgi:hypothetical protein